jgi:chromosome segregation ATPase
MENNKITPLSNLGAEVETDVKVEAIPSSVKELVETDEMKEKYKAQQLAAKKLKTAQEEKARKEKELAMHNDKINECKKKIKANTNKVNEVIKLIQKTKNEMEKTALAYDNVEREMRNNYKAHVDELQKTNEDILKLLESTQNKINVEIVKVNDLKLDTEILKNNLDNNEVTRKEDADGNYYFE